MDKGICILSNIPIRKDTSSTSEMISMMLFGETATVIGSEGEWFRICCDEDGYEGWVNQKQLAPLTHEVTQAGVASAFPLTLAQHREHTLLLLPGSSLPQLDNTYFTINSEDYQLDATPRNFDFKDIEHLASQFLNTPYLWGGRSLFGIDCSGFTQVVFKIAGIRLKRDAWMQANQGETVAFREAAQTGDLAFFDNAEGHITHVGIMLDNNRIIHASGKVRIDTLDNYGIICAEDQQYSHKLRIIKRIRA